MAHLWLVGMMGAGKTTVGVVVAQIVGLRFIDTDVKVMAETGSTISELFDEGEEVFREVEADVLSRIAEGESSVIGTGGGAVMSGRNVSVMQGSGTIILLDVDVPTIVERVGFDPDRPLFSSSEALTELFEQRREVYKAVADHVVATVGRDPQDVAKEVAACINM